MGAYDTPIKECPYCKSGMQADWVDVGVGMQQCGPYHCFECGASEIGPELYDWFYKDREGNTIYLPGKRRYLPRYNQMVKWGTNPVLIPGHPFTKRELETGYYQGKISPYANTVNGNLVNHREAKNYYDVGLLDEKDIGGI